MLVAKRTYRRTRPPLLPKATFQVFKGDDGTLTDHYYRRQIVEVAKRLDYFADTRTHRAWVRLDLRNGIHGILLIAFHGFGQDFNGLLTSSGIWFEKVQSDQQKSESTTPIPLAVEPFIINYRESVELTKERFEPWFDECTSRAIQHFEIGAFQT